MPDADDTVTIPNPRVVTVTGAQSAHILNVNGGGVLTLDAGATLTMAGTAGSSFTSNGSGGGTGVLRTQGTTAISISGTFTIPLEITGGTTNASGSTIGGSITILNGATFSFSNQTVTHSGDLTVNAGGTLTSSSGTYNFTGANVVNNGTITSPGIFDFERAGTQNFSGTGTFTGDARIIGGSTTVLTGSVTLGNGAGATSLSVSGGAALTVNTGITLTLNQVAFTNGGSTNSTGAGLIRFQGASSFAISQTLTIPIEINSGTTNVLGSTIDGPVTIASGATLNSSNQTVTFNGDLIVNLGGTMTKSSSSINANGANIVNNGTITGGSFNFARIGTQNFSGAGTITAAIAVINGSVTTLTSDVTIGNGIAVSSLTINGGGTLAVGGNTLTLNGVGLTSNGTFTSTAAGKIRTQATSSIAVSAAFTGSLEINSGTTSASSANNIGGSLTVLSGATYSTSNQVISIGGDLTNSGTITKSSGSISFSGANLTNSGTISIGVGTLNFSGASNLSGAGVFTGTFAVLNGGIVTLTSDVTIGNGIAASSLTINGGGTLAVGGNFLTLNGVALTSNDTFTSTGAGKIRTQAASSIAVSAGFTGSLEINSGTTAAAGTNIIGGSLTIASGATLNTTNQPFTVNGDLTNNGAITKTSGTFTANGANIVNNGTIGTSGSFTFSGTTQTLSGTGSISLIAAIVSGTTVTLGGNHQLGSLGVNGGGTLDTAAFTLFLNGAGTPLSGGGTIANVNITYNGAAAQFVQTLSVSYNQLGINNAAGVTLSAAETVNQRVILTNGTFSNGAFLTLAGGATIERSNGTLASAPTLGGTVNLEYTGATNVTTGIEFPVSTGVVNNLTINKTAASNTVALNASRTINGAMTLINGQLLTGAFTISVGGSGTATGSSASYVIGAVQKIFPAPAAFTFHVGTAGGYSPATINVDAGAGDFIVSAADGVITGSGLDPARTLQRYWSLTPNGITQADITFNYLQADVPVTANEAGFRFTRNDGGTNNTFFTPSSLNTIANIATLNNVTQFSDWTLNALVPTAAGANIGGRVLGQNGLPLAGVRVDLFDAAASVNTVKTTDATGNYIFPNMLVGGTYTINVARRGYNFNPPSMVYNHVEEALDLNFVGTRDLSVQPITGGSDFDGDGRADLSIWRPSNEAGIADFHIRRSDNSFYGVEWGVRGDQPTVADFDGDGQADFAVWREISATEAGFYILLSSNGTMRFETLGLPGDKANAVGDWDGDGKADAAVYRQAAGGNQSYFFYRGSLNNPQGNVTSLPWGIDGDENVRGDFDGDGKLDAAIYRPSNATWYIRQSSNGILRTANWGINSDKRFEGDFDGDGKTDLCVFRSSNAVWYILPSSNGQPIYRKFGLSSDQLAPADYDGDGRTDVAVFRSGIWYVLQSGSEATIVTNFGQSGDTPVASAFIP